MEKTTREYYDLLMAQKQTMESLRDLQPDIDDSQRLLDDLTTTSKVSEWRLLVWLMAYALFFLDKDMNKLASAQEVGTAEWYRNVALEFEYGVPLVLVNYRPGYASPNPANRVIKFAAVVESQLQQGLTIKVAGADGQGRPMPLPAPIKTAFEYYINRVRMAGTRIGFISQDADDLKAGFDLYYDPLVMNPDGSLIRDSSVFPVDLAIETYLTRLDFNGTLHMDSLTDAIQGAEGIRHAVARVAAAKKYYQLSPLYVDILAETGQKYNAEAGFLKISTEPGEGLRDLNQYFPA